MTALHSLLLGTPNPRTDANLDMRRNSVKQFGSSRAERARDAVCARSPSDQRALLPGVERTKRTAVGQMLLQELAQEPLVGSGVARIALLEPAPLRPFGDRAPGVAAERRRPPG